MKAKITKIKSITVEGKKITGYTPSLAKAVSLMVECGISKFGNLKIN